MQRIKMNKFGKRNKLIILLCFNKWNLWNLSLTELILMRWWWLCDLNNSFDLPYKRFIVWQEPSRSYWTVRKDSCLVERYHSSSSSSACHIITQNWSLKVFSSVSAHHFGKWREVSGIGEKNHLNVLFVRHFDISFLIQLTAIDQTSPNFSSPFSVLIIGLIQLQLLHRNQYVIAAFWSFSAHSKREAP